MIPTPIYSERSLMGSTNQDVFSRLLSDRIIMLFDEINEYTSCIVISQLLFLEAVDPEKDIRVYINSPGGSVIQGLAIYDTIKHLRCDVSTLCVGEAASMGAILLSAGTKGKRYALENSTVMIHQVLGEVSFGQAADIKVKAEQIEHVKKKLDGILAKTTGRTPEEIALDTDRDRYMTPFEAVEYGLIDGVITNE